MLGSRRLHGAADGLTALYEPADGHWLTFCGPLAEAKRFEQFEAKVSGR